jgi:hypothetical protein
MSYFARNYVVYNITFSEIIKNHEKNRGGNFYIFYISLEKKFFYIPKLKKTIFSLKINFLIKNINLIYPMI